MAILLCDCMVLVLDDRIICWCCDKNELLGGPGGNLGTIFDKIRWSFYGYASKWRICYLPMDWELSFPGFYSTAKLFRYDWRIHVPSLLANIMSYSYLNTRCCPAKSPRGSNHKFDLGKWMLLCRKFCWAFALGSL